MVLLTQSDCGIWLVIAVFSFLKIYIFLSLAEEKMLHEELHLKWDELSRLLRDQQILDSLRPYLVVGVSQHYLRLLFSLSFYYSLHSIYQTQIVPLSVYYL